MPSAALPAAPSLPFPLSRRSLFLHFSLASLISTAPAPSPPPSPPPNSSPWAQGSDSAAPSLAPSLAHPACPPSATASPRPPQLLQPMQPKEGRVQREVQANAFRYVWRNRYLELAKGPVLSLYASEQTKAAGKEPLETFPLETAVLSNAKSPRPGRYAFRLDFWDERGKPHKWILACHTPYDASLWTSALQAAGIRSTFSEETMHAQSIKSATPRTTPRATPQTSPLDSAQCTVTFSSDAPEDEGVGEPDDLEDVAPRDYWPSVSSGLVAQTVFDEEKAQAALVSSTRESCARESYAVESSARGSYAHEGSARVSFRPSAIGEDEPKEQPPDLPSTPATLQDRFSLALRNCNPYLIFSSETSYAKLEATGPMYSLEMLQNDATAGVTVGLVLVPQAVAYAMLAECEPIAGLYTSLVPLLVFAPLTASRHLALGPFALISLLVSETVSQVVSPADTDAYRSAIALLTLMVGLMHLLMRLLRLDVIVSFLSDAVLDGFQSASAVLIASSQLKNVLGFSIPRGQLPNTLWEAAIRWRETNLAAVAITVGSIYLMEWTKKLNAKHFKGMKLPEQLVPLLVGAALSWVFSLEQNLHLRVVGPLPSGLPSFTPPPVTNLALAAALVRPALVVGLFSYVLVMAIVKNMGVKYDYPTDAKRELVAFGAANVAGAFFGAYPAAGSLSRSALVSATCGANCTPAHGVFSALLVLLTLLLLTPAFAPLPYPVLASIVLMAIKSLINIEKARQLAKLNRIDFGLWLLAFVATLLCGVQTGISAAVAASLLVLLVQIARPSYELLGRLPGTDIFRELSRFGEARAPPSVAIVRMSGTLNFLNAEHFLSSVLRETWGREGEAVHVVVLDMAPADSMDVTGVRHLQELRKQLMIRNQALFVCECQGQPSELLSRVGFFKQLGRDAVFARVSQAVRVAEALGTGRRDSVAEKRRARRSRTSDVALNQFDFGDIPDVEPPKME